jgi:hypothetical protein
MKIRSLTECLRANTGSLQVFAVGTVAGLAIGGIIFWLATR